MSKTFLKPSGGPLVLVRMAILSGKLHPKRYMRFLITFVKLSWNWLMAALEDFFFFKSINQTGIGQAPVFILGHFRSGTSFIHKLMVNDSRWRYVSEYEIIFPFYIPVIKKIFQPLLQAFINIFQVQHPNFNHYRIKLTDPSEDEAMLLSSGASWSAYWVFVFPTLTKTIIQESIRHINKNERECWKNSYLYFVKKILWKSRGHLIIKSPIHTARIEVLLELFPNARFIYLQRDPKDVHQSMRKIWNTEIKKYFCMEDPADEQIQRHIKEMYELLISGFTCEKNLIPPENLVEIPYDELISEPFQTIRNIYNKFNLPFEESFQHKLNDMIAKERSYRQSKY